MTVYHQGHSYIVRIVARAANGENDVERRKIHIGMYGLVQPVGCQTALHAVTNSQMLTDTNILCAIMYTYNHVFAKVARAYEYCISLST